MNKSHQPRKRFGQNFLVDQNVIDKIISTIAPSTDEDLVEIGPGPGAITEKLIDQCRTLQVIEIDRDLAAELEQRHGQNSCFSLVQEDALKVDYSELAAAGRKITIVGNLPYNISTPLLFHLFKFPAQIERMIFMLQKEVVNRICAQPGDADYGRLSIMAQYFCQPSKFFEVSPQAFRPAPKVDSAIIGLVPWTSPRITAHDPVLLADIVRTAFTQRRKTLRNSLKHYLTAETFKQLQIDPSLRPENLSVHDYVRISNLLKNS